TLYPFPADLIRTRMKEVLIADNPGIDNIIDYLTENSGKMIRPRMVFLTASMTAHDPLVVRDAAVAVELIHLASLVHDDVIDHATMRRGRESINSIWGNHASVLTGDYLFASAFNLINMHGMQDIMENVTTTIRIMCAGEIKQMSLAGDLNVTEDQYLEKTFGKTACLFASSCKVGALAGSMPSESVYALEQFGLCLGYAYQIQDDLLDFLSESSLLGKPVGTDLLEGNITLPVIYALKSKDYGAWLRSLLETRQLNAQQMAEVIEVLIDSKGVEYSLHLSRQFIARGISYLDILPVNPAIKELKLMASYLLETYYQKLSHYERPSSQEVAR
ncbi:MAG: polyprenyl synthetase family protein, partial [Syntrophomonas sp.]|nr:polyprenyl synthetase family protein [Syntrophomonas sp.]